MVEFLMDSRANALLRRFSGAPLLSMASQIIGLMQLLLLVFRTGASNATDSYLYLFNMGMLPIQVLIVGIMYPRLLNNARITAVGVRRIGVLAPIVSVMLVVAGSAWIALQGRWDAGILLIASLCAVNAAIQAVAWFHAVSAEAGGNPIWTAAVALPANLLATLVLVLPWADTQSATVAMLIALVVGNAVLVVLMRAKRVGHDVRTAKFEPQVIETSGGTGWFFSKAAAGYVGQALLQTVAVTLPPASVTILNFAVKIVGAVSATMVNAVMPRLVHQTTETPSASRRFLNLLLLTLASFGLIAVGVIAIWWPAYMVPAIAVLLWVLAAAAAAVAQRMAFRFLKPNASAVSIVVIVVIVVIALILSGNPGFPLVFLICCYVGLDGATAAILLFALRARVQSFAMFAVLAAASAIGVTSWFN